MLPLYNNDGVSGSGERSSPETVHHSHPLLVFHSGNNNSLGIEKPGSDLQFHSQSGVGADEARIFNPFSIVTSFCLKVRAAMTASPSRYQNRANRIFLYGITLVGLILCLLIGMLYLTDLGGAESPGCRLIYMVPSYARIQGMDSAASRYASKYSLYLYREVDKDAVPPNDYQETDDMSFLNGIPVLFIPGNAGSYKQVRSIAAETANLYYGDDETPTEELNNPNAQNFDFFAADFNEDFTAFHGQTIMEQADYLNEAVRLILSLYAEKPTPPTSVVIVGHSMGGIVARVMITLPTYIEDSVKSMITLASPHAAAPLTFDGDIIKVYSSIDKFWYEGYQNISQIANKRVKDLSLISITGGGLDATLPADYTTIGHLVPPLNGFTVYTTGMPSVWSPIDHLAIVWCGQLRRVIAKSLLEIADSSSPSRVYPLEQRMSVFRKTYLSGFENYAVQDSMAYKSAFNTSEPLIYNLKIDMQNMDTFSLDKDSHMKLAKSNKGKNFNLFTIPAKSEIIFNLLSSLKFSPMRETILGSSSIFLCNNHVDPNKKIARTFDYFDSSSSEYASLFCIDISQDMNLMPRSSVKQVMLLADSSFLGSQSPFYGLHLNSTILSRYDAVLVTSDSEDLHKDENAFVIGETAFYDNLHDTLGSNGLFALLLHGAEISLPSNRPLMFNIQIPSAWSSILAYKIRLRFTSDKGLSEGSKSSVFSPFIRQWSDEPFETKWYINLGDDSTLILNSHNVAPYTPFRFDKKTTGLTLQLWSENNLSDGPLDINLSIDYIMSLRLLVLRYRLTVVSFCVLTCLLVLLRQLIYFKNFKVFPDFQTGLQLVTSPPMFVSCSLLLANLNWVVQINLINKILSILDPVTLRDRELPSYIFDNGFHLNKLFLGLEEDSLSVVPIIFYCMGIFIVFLTYKFVSILLLILGTILSLLYKLTGSYGPKAESQGPGPKEEKPEVKTQKGQRDLILVTKFRGLYNKKRRLVVTIFVLSLVAYQVPFQVVTVICCAAQGINCLKLYAIINSQRDSKARQGQQLLNYQVSIFLLMLWVMPVDIPIVIVYIHNLAIKWQTAFSSHHNILSILPIMLFLERNVQMTNEIGRGGKMNLEWINCSFRVTVGIMIYFVGYCLIYGTRHTFWIHHLFNIMCAWMLWLQVYQYES